MNPDTQARIKQIHEAAGALLTVLESPETDDARIARHLVAKAVEIATGSYAEYTAHVAVTPRTNSNG